MRKPAFCIFSGPCILTSFSLVTLNVRGVSNKHCLLPFFIAYAKTKMQIISAVTAKLICTFVFAIQIEQSLFFLNPKFQASSQVLWIYSPVCVNRDRKPRRPVFLQRGSYAEKQLICSFGFGKYNVYSKSRFSHYTAFMSHFITKPGFGNQVKYKPGCTTTEDG